MAAPDSPNHAHVFVALGRKWGVEGQKLWIDIWRENVDLSQEKKANRNLGDRSITDLSLASNTPALKCTSDTRPAANATTPSEHRRYNQGRSSA